MVAPILSRLKKYLIANKTKHYPYPAYDISLAGNIHLHLIGSIHMASKNMFPLPQILINKLNQCDALIVEADITDTVPPLTNNPVIPYPPVKQRLSPALYLKFKYYCQEIKLYVEQLDRLAAWQIALILQANQAQNLGLLPQYGIDYQLLLAARQQQKPIIELEGATSQIELLMNLPNNGQSLLEDTLTYWHSNARSLQIMLSWWMNFKPEVDLKLPRTFRDDVYQLLMQERNLLWCQKLKKLSAGHYVVAVGALHLYGDNNLASLFKQQID
ncbi:MAG TPA: TraB/GumN family protein [Arsenophonus apicola]|jgi:uncharacterized protein|uniref:TraB/GumN family protein n=1 Tax=Arsenophonus apicola TaxID=2879119 RepID=UPI00387990BE